jgi:hypothetical protein
LHSLFPAAAAQASPEAVALVAAAVALVELQR